MATGELYMPHFQGSKTGHDLEPSETGLRFVLQNARVRYHHRVLEDVYRLGER